MPSADVVVAYSLAPLPAGEGDDPLIAVTVIAMEVALNGEVQRSEGVSKWLGLRRKASTKLRRGAV